GEIEIVRALKFPDRARRLGLNEELNGAHAMGAVADDGWWDERPADSSAHQERGVLASIQGPVWEIPQRPLSAPRLVHAESAQPLEGEADAKRVVRAPGDMLAARDLTVSQEHMHVPFNIRTPWRRLPICHSRVLMASPTRSLGR